MESMSVEQLQSLLTVKQVAEMHEVPARVVRKAVKDGTIPGHVEVLGKSGFEPDKVTSWVAPEPGTRVVGAKRADGRQRYRIYLTKEEAAKLLSEGYELSDPREAAKARKAARKATGDAAPEAESEDADDLFAGFDV